MAFTVVINGHQRIFAGLIPPVPLPQLVAELKLQGDRVAIEHNGGIVQRAHWPTPTSPKGTVWRSSTSSAAVRLAAK